MYINFAYLKQKCLPATIVPALVAIHQNKTQALGSLCEELADRYLELLKKEGLVEWVQAKNKSQSSWDLIRLSSKGKTLLNNIDTPEILEEDIKVFEWLKTLYLSLGKEIGNGKATKTYIALFRTHSGIARNALVKLCKDFTEDEEQMKYSHKLQNVFFKPEHIHQTKFSLDSSRLWAYYQKHKDHYDKEFEKETYTR